MTCIILAVSLKVFVITKWHLVTLHKMYELGSAQGVLMDQGTAVFDGRTWKRFLLACIFLFLSRTLNRAFSCVACNMFNSVHLTRSITSDLRSCGAHHKKQDDGNDPIQSCYRCAMQSLTGYTWNFRQPTTRWISKSCIDDFFWCFHGEWFSNRSSDIRHHI